MKKDRVEDKFLEELRKIPIVQLACQKCDVSRNSVYRWRREDPEFAELMADALDEGEEYINDLGESQLITLIKQAEFPAIKYFLSHRHPKYRQQKDEVKPKTAATSEANRVIEEMGLGPEDFEDKNLEETTQRITRYILRKDGLL